MSCVCQVLQKRILGLWSPLPFEFFNQSHHYQPPAAQAAVRLPSTPPSDEASPARASTRLPCQFFHSAYSTSVNAKVNCLNGFHLCYRRYLKSGPKRPHFA